MKIKTLKDIPELKGKRVLVRVDFNVPMSEEGEIEDDTRIRESLPTLKHLISNGARLIIMSHLGRPKGQVVEELRLTKVAKRLSKLIEKPVKKLDEILGDQVTEAIKELQDSEILMLENIRFNPGEKECDPDFTKQLAALGEIYVNDAFGTAHRKHASTAGLADHLPAFGGLLMEKEIEHLSPIIKGDYKGPLTMIFGGAKIDTKIEIIKAFLDKADYFLLGGGLANTFLFAAGYNVGNSLYEENQKDLAQEIMAEAEKNGKKFLLPEDVIVADELEENAETANIPVENVIGDMKILDVGKKTTEKFCKIIHESGTIIWNGPLGVSEYTPFRSGSKAVAQCIATATTDGCTSILGGGDTIDCIKKCEPPANSYTHVSTGGGASIEFLTGKMLPGIAAIS